MYIIIHMSVTCPGERGRATGVARPAAHQAPRPRPRPSLTGAPISARSEPCRDRPVCSTQLTLALNLNPKPEDPSALSRPAESEHRVQIRLFYANFQHGAANSLSLANRAGTHKKKLASASACSVRQHRKTLMSLTLLQSVDGCSQQLSNTHVMTMSSHLLALLPTCTRPGPCWDELQLGHTLSCTSLIFELGVWGGHLCAAAALCSLLLRNALAGGWEILFTLLELCVSSLRRGHANILRIAPMLTDDPRRESGWLGRSCFVRRRRMLSQYCCSIARSRLVVQFDDIT